MQVSSYGYRQSIEVFIYLHEEIQKGKTLFLYMTNRKAVVYLGYSAFPHGLAEVQKIILTSKSLLLTGNNVTVICRYGNHSTANQGELKTHGFYENIEYIYASGSPFRNKSFLKRRVFKIKGVINEIAILRKRKKEKRLDYAILSTGRFFSIVYYSILSKLIGFKTILTYVEYYSAMERKWFQFGRRLNDNLFDKYAPSLTSATFLISEFLIRQVMKVSPGKKYLKIPGLTDFEKYNGIKKIQSEKYFLFCGSVEYKEILWFCIDAFNRLKDSTSVFLYLVANGDENKMKQLKEYIFNGPGRDKIRVFSKLSEKQLYTYYKNATALLIPLRPTFQDAARFPHKTGEYLASENPVISTNYGEVKNYFKDRKDMLLADSYDIHQFAEKMQFVIDNPEEAKDIGLKGKCVASTIFDYRNMAPVIDNFLKMQL